MKIAASYLSDKNEICINFTSIKSYKFSYSVVIVL